MRRRECGWVPWIEMGRLNPVDHFHSAAQVAWRLVVSVSDRLFWCVPPLRDPTETIPTISPCSRQCWRRIEMEARAAKRTQVCGWWDGKPVFRQQLAPHRKIYGCFASVESLLSVFHADTDRFQRFRRKIKTVAWARLKAQMWHASLLKTHRQLNHRLHTHIHHELTTPGW